MKKLALTILAIAGVTTAVPAAAQATQPYSNLFVFGDSLVDSGNAQTARALAGGVDPAPAALGYYDGRFSNGYNFADYLARALDGSPATASLRGGSNFSVGGAQAQEVPGDASPSFAEQIAAFDLSGQQFTSSALVLVTLGGNDVRSEIAKLATIPGYRPDLAPAITAMSDGLTSLFARGARNILVTGLPDIGQIPAVTQFGSPALEGAGTQLSFGLNNAFASLVGGFAQATGANFQFFDLFAGQRDIYMDPAAYGVSVPLDTRNACLQVPGAGPQCDGFVYFDLVHPTTQIHRAIASGIAGQLGVTGVPEPTSWALMIVGIGGVGAALRRRPRRMPLAA